MCHSSAAAAFTYCIISARFHTGTSPDGAALYSALVTGWTGPVCCYSYQPGAFCSALKTVRVLRRKVQEAASTDDRGWQRRGQPDVKGSRQSTKETAELRDEMKVS